MGIVADKLMQKIDTLDYDILDTGNALRIERIIETGSFYRNVFSMEELPILGAVVSLVGKFTSYLNYEHNSFAYSRLSSILDDVRIIKHQDISRFQARFNIFADIIRYSPQEHSFAFIDAEIIDNLSNGQNYREVISSFAGDSYDTMSQGLRLICSSSENYQTFLSLRDYKSDFGTAFAEHIRLLAFKGNKQMLETYIQLRSEDSNHENAIVKSMIATLPIYHYADMCRVFTAPRTTFASLPG